MDGKNFDELTRRLARGTSRRSVVRGLLGGAALVGARASGTLAGPQQPRAPQPKVDICHYDRDLDLYVWLNVNGNALSDTGHSLHANDFQRGTENGCCNDNECVYEGICGEAYCNHETGACAVRATPGEPCDDGFACTTNDECGTAVGTCAGTPDNSYCDDDNVCTDDVCDPANSPDSSGCVYTNNDASCDDGDLCTIGDYCSGGSCQPGDQKDCGDCGDCDAGVCSAGTCSDECDVCADNGDGGFDCGPVDDPCCGSDDPCCGAVACGASCCDVDLICVNGECKVPCLFNSDCDSGCCQKNDNFCLPPTANPNACKPVA